MKHNIRTNIELGAQIAIAIAIVVVAGVLVKRNLFPRQANLANLPRINAGERLDVSNVDWKQNNKSLVFFLNKDCHYCTSSAPFYRELIGEALKRNVKSLAILPNSIEEAEAYLRSIELPVDNVRTGALSSYKVAGTPTVLFVNRDGIVEKAWFGAAIGREKQMRDEFVALFDKQIASVTPAKL